jgi:hypothetical protein
MSTDNDLNQPLLKGFRGGKTAGQKQQETADAKLNQNLRSNVTVDAPTSKKPKTMAPFADVGRTLGPTSVDARPSPVPMRNYWGMQFAAPATSQYSRGYNDYTPTVQRRDDGGAVSGRDNVQLINPVATTSRKRIVLYTAAGYLWAVAPRIPGQTRDNFGGFHMRGIDPNSYAALVARGPGSQPVNPGGPGKIAGRTYFAPSTAGGINNAAYGASS